MILKRNTSRKRGLTLVELSTGLMMSMMVAAAMMALVSQQVSFMRLLNAQSFLRDEAPAINQLLTRMFSSASSYRIYGSKSNAFSGTGAVNTGGAAVHLTFRQPDGTTEERVIAFETIGGEQQLNFYSKNGAWASTPNWTITSQPTAVNFANDTGVLLVSMTGPTQEEITYVGK